MSKITALKITQNILGYTNSIVSGISFWCSFISIYINICFGVNISDIIKIYFSFNTSLKAMCFFYIFMNIVFLIIFIINVTSLHRKRISFPEILATYGYEIVSMPYRGLDISRISKGNINNPAKSYELKMLKLRIVKMLIFWGMIIVTSMIILSSENSILSKIKNSDLIFLRFMIFVVIAVFINIILKNIKIKKIANKNQNL